MSTCDSIAGRKEASVTSSSKTESTTTSPARTGCEEIASGEVEVSKTRGTPSHHPFIDGFSFMKHPAIGYSHLWKPHNAINKRGRTRKSMQERMAKRWEKDPEHLKSSNPLRISSTPQL
jgi:hypothetical protein